MAAIQTRGHLKGHLHIRRSLSSPVVISLSNPVIHRSSEVAIRLSNPAIHRSSQVVTRLSNPVIRHRVDIRRSRRSDIHLSSQGHLALKGLVSLQAVPRHRARRAQS